MSLPFSGCKVGVWLRCCYISLFVIVLSLLMHTVVTETDTWLTRSRTVLRPIRTGVNERPWLTGLVEFRLQSKEAGETKKSRFAVKPLQSLIAEREILKFSPHKIQKIQTTSLLNFIFYHCFIIYKLLISAAIINWNSSEHAGSFVKSSHNW